MDNSVLNSTSVLRDTSCYTGNNENDIACARKLTPQQLLNVAYIPTIVWCPTIDHSFLPEDPQILARDGKFNNVPTIIG